jgi:hypothetical protein
METPFAEPAPSRACLASPSRFAGRLLVFVFVAASALTLASVPARAEAASDTKLVQPFDGAVRRRRIFATCWEIDEAVITAARAAPEPGVRDQLWPVLFTAYDRHAAGYDRLRDALCTDDESMSADRAHACATLVGGLEEGWRRNDRIEKKQWAIRTVATAAYAGAITVATIERDQSVSRDIATAAGAPIGAAVGVIAFAGVANTILSRDHPMTYSDYSPGGKIFAAGMMIGGALAGGVAGGWVAHSLAASPDSRAGVTLVGLTPVYLTTLVMTVVDW